MIEKGIDYKLKIVVCLVILIGLLFPLFSGPRFMNFAIHGIIGAIITLGLNIFFGYCGQINFGSAGFFAVGGYTVALLEKYLHLPFIVTLIAAFVVTGVVSLFLSIFFLRLRGHSLALGTFAFSLAVYTSVAKGFKTFTGGEDGINLAPVMLSQGVRAGDTFYYYCAVAVLLACVWLSWTLRESRVGRAMIEIAQNEAAAQSYGVNINKYIRLGLVLDGLICGVAGAIFVKWCGWISPEYFGIMANMICVLALVVGGIGSVVGAVFGGVSMYILPLVMIRFAEVSVLSYGVILSVFVLFLPRGVVGEIKRVYYNYKAKSIASQAGVK